MIIFFILLQDSSIWSNQWKVLVPQREQIVISKHKALFVRFFFVTLFLINTS